MDDMVRRRRRQLQALHGLPQRPHGGRRAPSSRPCSADRQERRAHLHARGERHASSTSSCSRPSPRAKPRPLYHALTRPHARRSRSRPPRHRHGARWPAAPVYIVHLSSEDALQRGREARDRGLPAFARNLPAISAALHRRRHAASPASKARSTSSRRPCARNTTRRQLWDGLRRRQLSRSSPPTTARSVSPTRKSSARTTSPKSPTAAPASKTACSSLYHHGVNQGSSRLNRFVELVSTAPARIFGMYPQKGEIAAGCDADIVIWDPERRPTPSPPPPSTCASTTPCSKASK